jgi:hypothetical protein
VKNINPDNVRQEILAEGAIATGGIFPINVREILSITVICLNVIPIIFSQLPSKNTELFRHFITYLIFNIVLSYLSDSTQHAFALSELIW